MDSSRLALLLKKHSEGSLGDAERLELDNWYLVQARAGSPLADAEIFQLRLEQMDKAFPFVAAEVRRVRLWPRIAVAAAAVVLVVFGIYFFEGRNRLGIDSGKVLAMQDVLPGKVGATLTLADGRRIALSQASDGKLAEEAGVVISKASDGQLVYEIKDNDDGAGKINTLSTANGETYQVRLPDGTRVWLNAGSSLRYPSSFASLKERRVELSGEGYFEVAKVFVGGRSAGIRMPFIVKTASQQVEVLGTHFNINSYGNEPSVRTTLLEGSVRVGGLGSDGFRVLKPGQESLLAGTGFSIREADTEMAMAWKNKMFLFYNVDMKTIMRQLERWYDVQVDMDRIPDREFYGEISRDVKLSEVLTMLGQTSKLKFKIEGRRVMLAD